MGLLAPLFLAGLIAIAVPILVHLVHRERKEPMPFPSLMFLRRVPFKSAKRQRIRYWLLFLLRTFALVLIVAAFARPWLKTPRAAAAAGKDGRDIAILIDRSYSMSTRGVWARAQSAAIEAIKAAKPEDRITVAAFGEHAEVLARPEDARNQAIAAVQALRPTGEVTRYAPAVRLAASALNRPNAEITWITDRQRSGWRSVEQIDVPAGTTTRVIDVAAQNTNNVLITDAKVEQSSSGKARRAVPHARISNNSDAIADVPAQLSLGGRVQQARTVRVPAHGSATVTFDPIPESAVSGEIHIDRDDDIATDNVVYFTAARSGQPLVRIISDDALSPYYFERALRAGDSAAYAIARAPTLAAADLADASVVVLLQKSLPAGKTAERLHDFVQSGGGLVLVSTPTRATNELLPIRNARAVERTSDPATLIPVDVRHPLFAAFASEGSDPFVGARVDRYLRGDPANGVETIARFNDGAPALAELRVGRGKVLYWATSFDRAAGDFVLQPGFAPFIQQLVQYAAGSGRAQQTFAVGGFVDVDNVVPTKIAAFVTTPSGERSRMPTTNTPRVLRLETPGVYQIQGESGGSDFVVANVDVSESDLTAADATTFEQAVTPTKQATVAPVTLSTAREDAAKQSIWWYMLIAAFALLLADTLLGNRLSRQTAP